MIILPRAQHHAPTCSAAVDVSSPLLDPLTPAVSEVGDLRVIHRVLLQLASTPTVVAAIRNGHGKLLRFEACKAAPY